MTADTSFSTGPHPAADQVLQALGCAAAILDATGVIVAANARWHADVGGAALGSRYLERAPAAHDVDADLDLVLAEGVGRVLSGRSDRFELEHPVDGPLGRRWHQVVATPLDDGAVVVHVDVTAHHDVRDILDARAHRDPLTGLPNRRAITQHLTNAVARSGRMGTPVAVVFVDLDGFKAVNDGLGHEVGDEVLAAVGRRLGGTIRADDWLGRWGGDEFVVVVDGGGEQAVRSLAGRLHDAVRAPVAVSEQRTVHLGLSVGAAMVHGGDTPEDVLARADSAMFEAKRTGVALVLAGAGRAAGDR